MLRVHAGVVQIAGGGKAFEQFVKYRGGTAREPFNGDIGANDLTGFGIYKAGAYGAVGG